LSTRALPTRTAATPPRGGLLQRRCACGTGSTLFGGACPECSKKRKPAVQARLRIGRQDDPLEREADQTAERVLRGERGAPAISRAGAAVQRDGPAKTAPQPPEGERQPAPAEAPGDAKGEGASADAATASTCSPRGLKRVDYLKEPGTSTKDFGLTTLMASSATVPAAVTRPAAKGGGVTLEATTAALPTIPSVYTAADTFVEGEAHFIGGEGRNPCPSGKKPIKWFITPQGANKIREGELDHCADFRLAFDLSLKRYAEAVNALAGKRSFPNQAAAEQALKKATGVHPDDWFDAFACLARKTKLRDRQGWHDPRPLKREPKLDDNCQFVYLWITESSLPEVGQAKHPASDIIKDCGEAGAKAPAATGGQVGAPHAEDGGWEPWADGETEETLMQRREASSAGGDPDTAPALVEQVLGSPGQPLDESARAFMEPRFGRDFSRVRVHTDARAAASARRVGALAYTVGHHLVFDRGQFDPLGATGRQLLAHELTHVVQQGASGDSPTLQRKPAPGAKTAKWYQEAIDSVDLAQQRLDEQRKQGGYVLTPYLFDNKKAVLALCEAVDANDAKAVSTRLDALLKLGLGITPRVELLSHELLTDLSARIFEMGLESEADRLRHAYADADRLGLRKDEDWYAAQRKVDFLKRLAAGAGADAKADDPAALAATMHRFTRAFLVLREHYLAIDFKALEQERQFGGDRGVMRPNLSRGEYHRAVLEQIQRWQEGLSRFIQAALDAARGDLGTTRPTGRGAALLKALRSAMVGELQEALMPKDESKNIAGLGFEITQTKVGKGSGTIQDAFDGGKSARSVPITTYDPSQDFVRELRSSLAHSWRVRIEQIHTLGRLYGVLDALAPDKDSGQTTRTAESSKDSAQSIQRMAGGRLRLDSDDDWRAFLLQRYNDLTRPQAAPAPAAGQNVGSGSPAPPAAPKAASPAEALHEIVSLLFGYLQAFTVHARFTNLYDNGDTSYLNRPFPRALTGQLVHDCGVYALRAAYMLSLVREQLGLRFLFVRLPAHVSLVITGDKLPTFICENNHFQELSPQEFSDLLTQWKAFTDPQTKAAPPGPADDTQFIGELAASDFIFGPADMPLRVSEVPQPVKDAKAEQKRLWTYYTGPGMADVLGPATEREDSPNFLFHQRYLAMTEETRQIVNEVLRPFWNEAAPNAWDRLQKTLADQAGKRSRGGVPAKSLPVDDLLTPLGEYRFDLEVALKPVRARYERFEADQRKVGERLRADPALARSDARISVGARAAAMWSHHWDSHLRRIGRYERDLVGRPTGATETLEAVTQTLQPFFMPREDKQLEPLD
jgi:hypothetical protein